MNKTINKPGKRLLSLALAMLLALGTLPQTVFAVGESEGGTITAFEPLEDSVKNQAVPLGTSLENLNLPASLTATVEVKTSTEQTGSDSGSVQDSGTPAQENAETDLQDGDTTGEDSVSGNNAPGSDADEQQNGTPSDAQPSDDGASLRVQSVTGSAITLGSSGADDTVGTQETVSVPVLEWISEPTYDPETTGTYVFTPVLEKAYTFAEGVELPIVTVEITTPVITVALNAAIQGGTPTFTLNGNDISVVGFGGHEWVVIGDENNGVKTDNADIITLLLKNDDAGGGYDATQFHGSSNHYSGSTLQDKMDEAYDSLPDGEKELVAERALEGGSANYGYSGYDDNKVAGDAVSGAHFWPLSVSEANSVDNSVRVFGGLWWLRSPGSCNDFAAVVNFDGLVSAYGYYVSSAWAVRPAFKLNLASVLFTSDASGASAKPTTVGASLSSATPPTGAVKFTMKDDNLNLTVSNTGAITAAPGGTVSIPYTDAVTGTNKYVSAVLTDGDTEEVLYYGKLVDLTGDSGASGTANFDVPDGLALGSYTLKLFNEECNGDNETDFASEPVEINLTVTSGGNDNFPEGTWTGANGHRYVEFGGMIWRVLEVTENDAEASGCTTALLLAEESVGSRQFHTTWNSGGDNDWNTSDIKAWLNNEICTKNSNDYTSNGFMSRFSDDEKGSIVTANYTYGGNYTGSGTTGSSKVFLLSVNEASKSDYFAGDADRAIGDYWWLRSPGNYRPNAAGVNDDGYVLANGYYVDIYSVAVRPALKINLASDIFTSKNPLVQAEITVTSSDSPVEDASISFSGASAPDGAILSGGEGKATAYLERDESYTMTVSKTGYEPYTATIEITQADQAIPVNLTLSDAIRPTVESITPANGAENVNVSGELEITFSEPMKTSEGTVSLDNSIGTLSGTWNIPTNTIFTVPYSGLDYSETYTITVADFEDAAGNTIDPDPATYSFTTKAQPAGPDVSPQTLNLDLNGNSTGTLDIFLGQSGNRAAQADIAVDSGSESDISVNLATLTSDGTVTVTGLQTVSGAGITVSFSGGTATPADIPVIVNVTDSTPPPATAHTITVLTGGNGTAAANKTSATQGETVTLTATPASGSYYFARWEVVSGGAILSGNSFVMPDNEVTVKAYFSRYSSGGSSDSSDSNRGTTVIIPPVIQPDWPTIGSVSGKVAGTNTQRTFTVTDSLVKAALEKAQAEAKKQNRTTYGVGAQIALDAPAVAGLTLTLERAALNRLVNEKAKQFELTGAPISLTFDAQALSELQKQGTGNVTITVKPVTVKNVRNAYDITLNTVKDGKTVSITSLGTGNVTLSIPSTPGKSEAAGYLYAVYVDGNGKLNRIADSTYDANSGSVIFSTNHFSVYGVGYTAPSAKFTDIEKHWAKESIDYVVGRGLLSGTSDAAFAPDTAMTRGMLVTALGRLAGVDTKAYTTNSFTDVKADSAFRPYIEWAYKKGIIQGIGNQQFAPDRAITREEIAVIFANYAKATGYKLPITREATTYADAASIGSAYKTAVTSMQQAGIMMGGTGNKFNPKSSATRAEVSSMLHRYIKLTIDPDTAQGWAKNDDGQFLYYKGGKPVAKTQNIDGVKYYFNDNGTLKTGWVKDDAGNWHFYSGNTMLVGFWDLGANGESKRYYFTKDGIMIAGKWLEIDGKWYYFNADGSLAKSTKIDGYEVDKNGVRKTK
ncbi:S-layer homology domain-containing protein [Kineothrix sedimenti]|uniref:S-layer homology domain-containing protein n=1 Tax=Kineothrix sedimenti TaxID=3123317 RepID=A0ABZ3F1D1_9FIRM